jgi:hypothetical protein
VAVANNAQHDGESKLKGGGEMRIRVSNQEEFNKAYEIGEREFEARGNSHVEARENSHVEAWENSHVEARENSHVEAWGNSHVEAWGNSHVEARGNSHVEAWGNSHVEARGNSHVEAWGNSHVVAWGNSHVEARENSHVVARENSHVVAWDYSVVVSDNLKSVKIGSRATAIKRRNDYPSDIKEWAKMKGVKIKDGRIYLWKCVSSAGKDFRTGTINYLEKHKNIVDPTWNANSDEECGYGLHLADSPSGARYFKQSDDARLLRVSARLEDCVCTGGEMRFPMKIRARACRFIKEFPIDYCEEF